MGLEYHPRQGAVIRVRFDDAFEEPEMQKTRLCVVLSKAMKGRGGLVTVVPLSLSAPETPRAFHMQIDIPFRLPERWGERTRWVKGDMIYSAAFSRCDLLRLGKDETGKRIYQRDALPAELLAKVQLCVLHGLSMGGLTGRL
ncbi:type II toxin-antitoxin system PemK/MazF family toxin [Litorisediminicola beolgyonensis]|uniref:Type II toxin-antitoxin system PemK/MazF family toxin n=1 Tax=Litorisediminicola beolgyonensis TaxID=1173614 RepID=A0ABW3ZG81_9RHOB